MTLEKNNPNGRQTESGYEYLEIRSKTTEHEKIISEARRNLILYLGFLSIGITGLFLLNSLQ